jgi:hypothetical protein
MTKAQVKSDTTKVDKVSSKDGKSKKSKKDKKNKKPKKVVEPVTVEPVVVEPVVVEPVVVEPVVVEPVVVEPVVVEPVVVEPVVVEPVVVEPVGVEPVGVEPVGVEQTELQKLTVSFARVVETLVLRIEEDRKLLKEVKELQKETTKRYTTLEKIEVKKANKKSKSKNNKPSGITKPTGISDELCEFLGVEKGTLVARTEVTKQIAAYYKEHGLQVPADKRLIQADDKLRGLLNCGEEPFVMFKLQTFLKPHFL